MRKQSKKQMKGNRGITLIALVVTIVVLLILAGITISTLFGDNGIISAARKATDETKTAENDTEKGLKNLVDNMEDELFTPTNITKGNMVDIKTKYAKYTDSTSNEVVPIPGGFGVVGDSKTNTNNKNTIASGLVISDLENDTLDNSPITVNGTSKTGNQFVWVPVSHPSVMYGVDGAGKKHGKLYEFGSSTWTNGVRVWTTYTQPQKFNWTEANGVMSITDVEGYREPSVLGGTTGSYYDADSDYLAILGLAEISEFETELETSFNKMIASVEKYGGFYIGRYETGNLETNKNNVPVVKRGNSKLDGANWYYIYQTSKNISNGNSNVTTSMIWGCQFDRALEWIVETNLKSDGTKDYDLIGTKSNTWGNYKNSTGAAANNSGIKQSSGYNEAWQKNHIYDLSGNLSEYTIGANGSHNRVYRGGCYENSNYPVYGREDDGGPIGAEGYRGSRATLYINL